MMLGADSSRTLYVPDLDGTLLGTDGRLSAESARLLNQAITAGVLFTYATARSFSSASRATEGLQLAMPVITYGGTMTVSSRDGSPELVRLLDEKPVSLMAAEFARTPAVEPVWFTFEDGRDWVRWRPDKTTSGLELFLAQRAGDRRLRPITPDDPLDPRGVFYVTVIAENAVLMALATMLSSGPLGTAAHFLTVDPSTPGLAWLEVHDGAGTKAHAIQRLAARYGAERLVVFGDNHNDVPMFTVADQGFAVSNAVPELKAVATGVIGHHDTDAVARHITGALDVAVAER